MTTDFASLNKYQRIMLKRAGSALDFSWDREKKIHTCCGSKADWCHKATCLQVIGSEDEIGNEKWKALALMDRKAYIDSLFA